MSFDIKMMQNHILFDTAFSYAQDMPKNISKWEVIKVMPLR